MASLAAVFEDKESTNWLKAWLAIDIAKLGLEQLADNEAQNFQQHIYNQVRSTCNSCSTTNLHDKKLCPRKICNTVCQEIINEHRYHNWSWKNTDAQLWQTNHWEIAKCYLPPDGYAATRSIKDTDFNGVVSLMLNCTRFNSKFSFQITTGKPTQNKPACLLYKAREIVKAVRHSSIMKVTVVDLQDYFTTFTNLLSDPRYLSQDIDAQNAVKKLAQLEKDTLQLTTAEMMCFLDAVGTTLKQHLKDVAKDVVDASVNDLRVNTALCLDNIEAYLVTCKQELAKHAELHTQDLNDNAAKCTQAFDENADKHSQAFDENADKRTQAFDENADKRTKEYYELTITRKKDFDENADKRLRDINEQCKNTTFNETFYKQSCEDMLRKWMTHYQNTLSQVTTSPLNDWGQERLEDIYMAPSFQLMKKDKGSFIKTGTQITEYKQMFYQDSKLNQHTFIQGEAGSGKSTFLAKLVMDWCSINTTQFVETLPMDETDDADDDSSTNFFKDLTTLKCYKFIFHVTLRESDQQFEIFEIIKKQRIDSIDGIYDRECAYKLLDEIMKRERCLVLLDGLDEWTSPGGHCLPALAVSYSQCDVLITTRPWKLTESKISDSKMDTLIQLEGVNEPFEVSKRLLACIGDCKESKDFDNKHAEFKSYVLKNELYELLVSPMLLSLVVHSWTEGTELNGSKCEVYSLLLEGLIKKANSETSEFQQPPYRCFTQTQYIQPNIEHLNRLAEAAFYLLFSETREKALVFTITELKKFNLGQLDKKNFALKSGILSATRKTSLLRSSSSYSFFHKSIQEFLAAYHLARNTNLINDVISGYLNCHEDAYLDIFQVFIFLCGLNMSAANKLSDIMDKHDALSGLQTMFGPVLQSIILKGYKEAIANQQNDILLKLSRYDFTILLIPEGCREAFTSDFTSELNDIYLKLNWHSLTCENDIKDLHSIWANNKSNVLALRICVLARESSPTRDESSSHFEFDLSSCIKLKSLELYGDGILLNDCASTSTAVHPVGIVLKSADPSQCADSIPVLPSIDKIILRNVTCSFSWQRSLLSSLLTLNHEVMCTLLEISIECEDGAKRIRRADINKGLNNSLRINIKEDSPILLKALHGLNIKTLCLREDLDVHHSDLSKVFSSLTHLETLSIETWFGVSCLWKALHGLNIKTLCLRGALEDLATHHVIEWSLSSLTHLETLCIDLFYGSSLLWKALHGLNIKNLRMGAMSGGFNVEQSQSQSLSSLTHLETLSITARFDSPGLWKALHGLNIKSLSIDQEDLNVDVVESLSQSLSSLTQLKTLTLHVDTYKQLQLPQSLKYLNIYCNALIPSKVLELVDTLPTCTLKVGSNLKVCCYLEFLTIENIPLEEYTAIQQELETRKNVTVERFQILNRKLETNLRTDDGVDFEDASTSKWNNFRVRLAYVFKTKTKYMNKQIYHISMQLMITQASIR